LRVGPPPLVTTVIAVLLMPTPMEVTRPPEALGFRLSEPVQGSFTVGSLPACGAFMSRNYITANGLLRIQRELHWLQTVERPKITREVGEAAAMGDRSENAEYIYGKKRLRQIDGRMRYLMGCLNKIERVEVAQVSGNRVLFGATVTVEDEHGEAKTWRIYGEHEVDVDNGILSWKGPLGRALIGKEAGDGVRFKAPSGWRELEVLEVRFEAQPELLTPEFDRD
jgi:transcription elongation factor GreB